MGGWRDRCDLVLPTVQGAKEIWAVVMNEPPSWQTLWQYALWSQKDSRLRSQSALERLYLAAALALLYATTQEIAVQIAGLRSQADSGLPRLQLSGLVAAVAELGLLDCKHFWVL